MTCNNKCIHYPVCEQRKFEFANIEECSHYCDNTDNNEIQKSVHLLDLFTKTFCRYPNDYERFDDLKFRCAECPFFLTSGECQVKIFKNEYYPDYKDFGSMGDL